MRRVWTTLQVQVVGALASGHTGDQFIQLSKPHMVLNMAGSPTTLHMQFSHTIGRGVPARDMLALVKRAGRLKHLVFGNDNAGNLRRAALSGSYVVAPINYMQQKAGTPRTFAYGRVDILERFQPKVFSPNGELIDWASFVRMGRQFGLAPS